MSSRKTAFTDSRIDPDAIMRLGSLALRARVVVEGFLSGLHRSPYHGFSVEFSEYRPYCPGDDPRFLDWKVYGRTDRYFLKRFEDETNLRCYFLLDLSRSMGFGSGEYSKDAYARTLVATLAHFLSTQRDAAGLMVFHESVGEFLPARYRPGHLHRLLVALEQALHGEDTDLASPLEYAAESLQKRSMVVLLSDLLADIDSLEKSLGFLRTRGHDVVVFRILDPEEMTLASEEPSLYVDVETGREMYIDPAVARQAYVARFEEHDARIRRACANLGIEYHRCPTDRPLQAALVDFVTARQRDAGGLRAAMARRSGGASA